MHFTKIKKFAFFLITIRFISQKSIIFAQDFKNDYKISIFFLNTQTYVQLFNFFKRESSKRLLQPQKSIKRI